MNADKIIKSFIPPVDEKLLLKYDFFTLYPNDGGGGFVMRDELPSLDDREISGFIFEKNGLADFGNLPELDYHKHAAWKTIERSCWINRLYWIVPTARTARLTGNREWARQVIDALLYFNRTQTAPQSADEAQKIEKIISSRRDSEYNQGLFNNPEPVPYQWYDFQPAARIIHIIYALWFMQTLDCWNDSEAEELIDMIRTHAQVISWQEEVLPAKPGNHQALRGLSMLYAGCFLNDQYFTRQGLNLMTFHALNDFSADGLLREVSPQYHCFESWMLRDICALSKNYSLELDERVLTGLKLAARACKLTTRPDGRAVPVNDGCNLDMKNFLETMPATAEESEHNLLPYNQIAVWRTGKWYMLFDASNFYGRYSHYHAGKNAFTLWYNNLPFIVDSGCCHYDWQEFKGYFKRGEAHASMLVDGMGDGWVTGTYNWVHHADCTVTPWQNNRITSTLTSTVPNWRGVQWQRSLETAENQLTVSDNITADAEHYYEFTYPLHPAVKVNIDGNKIVLSNEGVSLELTLESNSQFTASLAPALWCDNVEVIDSRMLRIQLHNSNAQVTTVIKPLQ